MAPSGASSGEQVSTRWPARDGTRWAHALASFCQEEDDDWQMAAWAGLHSNWAEVGRQVSGPEAYLPLSVNNLFCFLFLLLCFDSVQRPNHFQNS